MLPNAELRKRLPLARYGRVDLIRIDELGYMDLDRRGTVQRPPCCRDPSRQARPAGPAAHRSSGNET